MEIRGYWFEASSVKNVHKSPSQFIKLGVVAYACLSSCAGSINRRTEVQVSLSINARPS
jgi:hypothetical protein